MTATKQYHAEFLVSIPMGTPPEDKIFVTSAVAQSLDETQIVKYQDGKTVAPGVWSVVVNFLAANENEARAAVNRAASVTGYPTDGILR